MVQLVRDMEADLGGYAADQLDAGLQQELHALLSQVSGSETNLKLIWHKEV